MPEGNETHRWATLHASMFAGRKVHVDSPQGRFADAGLLDGRKLCGVVAVGKHLGYDFGIIEKQRRIVHVHMGLYGDFTEGSQPMPEPRGALRMRIWDRRQWLELRGPTDCSLWTDEDWQALLARLGPDPLNVPPKVPAKDRQAPAKLIERIGKRRTAIGLLLMDQSIVSGLGNILRAELLFRARVSPFRPGNEVPEQTLQAIWKDAVELMPPAMVDRRIVTTMPKDRPHRRGTALDEEAHYVYRRKGRPCFVCGTEIRTQVMGGRNLFWCPHCQAD
jgi:endonuclease-8